MSIGFLINAPFPQPRLLTREIRKVEKRFACAGRCRISAYGLVRLIRLCGFVRHDKHLREMPDFITSIISVDPQKTKRYAEKIIKQQTIN